MVIGHGSVSIVGVFLLGRYVTFRHKPALYIPAIVLVLYLGWSLLSIEWSVAQNATAARAIIAVGVAAFAFWFGFELSIREQITSIFVSMQIAVLLSSWVMQTNPKLGYMYPPFWYPEMKPRAVGIFGNPNSLGPVCALAALSLMAELIVRRRLWIRCALLPFLALDAFVLYKTGSLTPVAGILVAFAVVGLSSQMRRVKALPPVGLVAGAGLLIWLAWRVVFQGLFGLGPVLGPEHNLSGRRWIWADVRSAASLRPWRGYGYFAFWDNEELTQPMYDRIGSPYGSAHNSPLEVLLGLGRVGLVLYIALAACAVLGLARALRQDVTLGALCWAGLFGFVVVESCMESFVLWHSYIWILFVAACVVPFSGQIVSSRQAAVTVLSSAEPSLTERPQPRRPLRV